MVRRAKEEQVTADLEERDLKKRWNKIRVIAGGEANTGPPKEIKDGNITYKDDVDIANSLNSGFWEKVKGIMKRVKIDPKKAM